MRKKMAAHMSKKKGGSKKKLVAHDPKALNSLNISKTIERFVNLLVTDAIAQGTNILIFERPSQWIFITNIYLRCVLLMCHSVTQIYFQVLH